MRNCIGESHRSAPIFVDTLGTLGQREFAFGFCGSTRSLVTGDPSVLFERSCCTVP